MPCCFLAGCPASHMPSVVNNTHKNVRPIFSWFDIISQYGSDISYVYGDIFSPGNPFLAREIHSNIALRVGDVVTLRDWDDMKKEFRLYGPDTIRFSGTDILMTAEKRRFCNGTYKIKNIPWVPFNEPPLYEFEDVPGYDFPIQCIASCLTSFDGDRR